MKNLAIGQRRALPSVRIASRKGLTERYYLKRTHFATNDDIVIFLILKNGYKIHKNREISNSPKKSHVKFDLEATLPEYKKTKLK